MRAGGGRGVVDIGERMELQETSRSGINNRE